MGRMTLSCWVEMIAPASLRGNHQWVLPSASYCPPRSFLPTLQSIGFISVCRAGVNLTYLVTDSFAFSRLVHRGQSLWCFSVSQQGGQFQDARPSGRPPRLVRVTSSQSTRRESRYRKIASPACQLSAISSEAQAVRLPCQSPALSIGDIQGRLRPTGCQHERRRRYTDTLIAIPRRGGVVSSDMEHHYLNLAGETPC